MKRTYFARGRRVLLDQIENVLAIKINTGEQGQLRVDRGDFGRIANRADKDGQILLPMDQQEADTFQQANWAFVVPSPDLQRAFEQRALPDQVSAVGMVFRREDGRIVIGTESMTVKLRPDVSPDEAQKLFDAAGLRIVRPLRFARNLFEVQVIGVRDTLDTSVAQHDDPRTEYCEPVFLEQIGGRYVPTDPAFGLQWQWRNIGSGDGVPGADVDAVAAWDYTRGAGVRLAVIDNGFNIQHEDLSAGIVDASGYFDGLGIFQRTLASYPPDFGDHGTFCAGMAAARVNNGAGGCGGAPECELMLVAALPDQVGAQITLARAVAYCADPTTEIPQARPSDGADVISCSLGPSTASSWTLTSVLDDAIRFAVANGRGGLGTPIFWACSNGNVLISDDHVVSHPDVVAVGRSNRQNLPDNSAFGPELHLLAPGRAVFSTRTGGLYGTKTGTSFAAPCAASVAALVVAVNPALHQSDVRSILRSTADKIGTGYDANGHSTRAGYGRVNARRAVEAARAQVGQQALPTGIPVIQAPIMILRGATPTFQVNPGGSPYYAVEVATDPALFNPGATGAHRTPDTFYATWQDQQSFFSSPSYQLPGAIWDGLKLASRLYYRIWANNDSSAWRNPVASTPDAQYQQTPFMRIAPSIEAPRQVSRAAAPVFQIDPSPYSFYAVEVATDAALFQGGGIGGQRTPDNFYATWQDPQSFLSQASYQLPRAVWNRLQVSNRLCYRIWANSNGAGWANPIASTPSNQYQRSPYFDIVP